MLDGLCRSSGGLSAERLALGALYEHRLYGAPQAPAYAVVTWEIATAAGLEYAKADGGAVVMGMAE